MKYKTNPNRRTYPSDSVKAIPDPLFYPVLSHSTTFPSLCRSTSRHVQHRHPADVAAAAAEAVPYDAETCSSGGSQSSAVIVVRKNSAVDRPPPATAR